MDLMTIGCAGENIKNGHDLYASDDDPLVTVEATEEAGEGACAVTSITKGSLGGAWAG